MSNFLKPVILRINDGVRRPSTWLELFFDLSYVIIVAKLADSLSEHPSWHGLGLYIFIFVPIWWVWNQFSIYSNQFDNGDYVSKFLFILAILVSLHLASSFPDMLVRNMDKFKHSYLALHFILFLQWLRTIKYNKAHSRLIKSKLIELGFVIVVLSISLFIPLVFQRIIWIVIVSIQLLSPFFNYYVLKEYLPVVRGHFIERFGLFTIILLGESLLVITVILEKHSLEILDVVAIGFFIVALLWWIYFEWDFEEANIRGPVSFFIFNYLHFFVFVAIGAFTEALQLAFEAAFDHHGLSDLGQDLTIGSIALFLLSIQMIFLFTDRATKVENWIAWPVIALLVLLIFVNNALTLTSTFLIVAGLLLVILLVRYATVKARRD